MDFRIFGKKRTARNREVPVLWMKRLYGLYSGPSELFVIEKRLHYRGVRIIEVF